MKNEKKTIRVRTGTRAGGRMLNHATTLVRIPKPKSTTTLRVRTGTRAGSKKIFVGGLAFGRG